MPVSVHVQPLRVYFSVFAALMALTEAGPDPLRIARAAVRAWRGEGVAATARVHRLDGRGARAT